MYKLMSFSRAAIILVVIHCISCVLAQSVPANGGTLDVTTSPLPSGAHWNSAQVQVFGIGLVATRVQAYEALAIHHLRAVDHDPIVGSQVTQCTTDWCAVENDRGVFTGIELHFDKSNRVDQISIGSTTEADPTQKLASVTKQLHGTLRDFFFRYSEDVRRELFGDKGNVRQSVKGQLRYVDCEYQNMGVTTHLVFSGRERMPFDVEVVFMTRTGGPR